MTATDTIRAMLDERGVEWEACRVPTLRSELAATFWYDRDGNSCFAVEGADDTPDGKLSVNANLTPEQAIEATLGSAELRKERDALDRLTDVLNATNDGLLAENAKLRELVRDFYPFALGRAAKSWLAVRLDRMRELGVEV